MATMTQKLTEHEATYRRLRDMVLFGALVPGQKVTIQGITQTLGAGMTPVREAIRRLTAEGALDLHGNRRISVPVLTLSQLEEMSHARLAIEPHLATLALREADGVKALAESLAAIDAQIDAAIGRGDIGGYLSGNHAFHFTLYAAGRAPVLMALTHSLWLRFGPSLRAVMTGEGSIGPDRHREALDALRRTDAAALEEAIKADIEQGLARVRAELGG
jgi:DNA-binding GntR family transcriptional regulator